MEAAQKTYGPACGLKVKGSPPIGYCFPELTAVPRKSTNYFCFTLNNLVY